MGEWVAAGGDATIRSDPKRSDTIRNTKKNGPKRSETPKKRTETVRNDLKTVQNGPKRHKISPKRSKRSPATFRRIKANVPGFTLLYLPLSLYHVNPGTFIKILRKVSFGFWIFWTRFVFATAEDSASCNGNSTKLGFV